MLQASLNFFLLLPLFSWIGLSLTINLTSLASLFWHGDASLWHSCRRWSIICRAVLLLLLSRQAVICLTGLMWLNRRYLNFADVYCRALITGSICIVCLSLIWSRKCITSRYRSLFTTASDPTVRCRCRLCCSLPTIVLGNGSESILKRLRSDSLFGSKSDRPVILVL